MAKHVSLPSPEGGTYNIDSTEVTAAQYSAWIETHPPMTLMPAFCSSKAKYNAGTGQYAVVDIDWCDAYAYCAGVDKHLCGKIGGGTNAYADYAKAGLSAWFNACSSDGADAYPYGNTYDGQACDGSDKGMGAPVAVASCTGCQSTVSGYTGVFDLSGNVWEWEDSCNASTGDGDNCRLRGGAYNSADSLLRCDASFFSNRSGRGPNIGFRCCEP